MKKIKDCLTTLGLLLNIIEEKSESINLWEKRQLESEKLVKHKCDTAYRELPITFDKLKKDILNPEINKSVLDSINVAVILNKMFDIVIYKDFNSHGKAYCYVELNKRNINKIEKAIIKYNKENRRIEYDIKNDRFIRENIQW